MSGADRWLVLDAGGVLVADAIVPVFAEIASASGRTRDDLYAHYHANLREAMWSGALSEAELWVELASWAGSLDMRASWRSRLTQLMTPLDASELTHTWHRHASIRLLSNHRAEWLRPWLDSRQLGDCFDRVWISSETGAVKPDPSAFEPLCRLSGSVLYVDDHPLNLEAADRLGIPTLLADGDWTRRVDDWLGRSSQ